MRVCEKKWISLVVCSSLVMGVCSCTSGSKDRVVLNAAQSLGIAVTKRDSSSLTGLSSDDDIEAEEIFYLGDDTSSDDMRAKVKLASTLSYTVDEESLTGGPGFSSGSVDIVFTFVDYEAVLDDSDALLSIDAFESAVSSCEDMEEVTLTFDYEVKDDKVTFEDLEQISDLFPYADEVFDFTVDYASFAGDITFDGDDYDPASNTYTDPTGLHCYMEIAEEGRSLDWSYYYTIDRDGSTVYTSTVLTCNDGRYLDVAYNSAALLDAGVYTVSIYSADDQLLVEGSVEVVITITPELPSSGQNIDNSYFMEPLYYVCPADNVIILPDSDVMIHLPDDMVCMDFESFMAMDTPFGDVGDHVVFFASDGSSYYATAIRFEYENYLSPEIYETVGFSDDDSTDTYIFSGNSDTPSFYSSATQYEYNVGGRTFRSLVYESVDSTYIESTEYVVLGDDDTCYLLIIYHSYGVGDVLPESGVPPTESYLSLV